jgi:hypothetical protein
MVQAEQNFCQRSRAACYWKIADFSKGCRYIPVTNFFDDLARLDAGERSRTCRIDTPHDSRIPRRANRHSRRSSDFTLVSGVVRNIDRLGDHIKMRVGNSLERLREKRIQSSSCGNQRRPRSQSVSYRRPSRPDEDCVDVGIVDYSPERVERRCRNNGGDWLGRGRRRNRLVRRASGGHYNGRESNRCFQPGEQLRLSHLPRRVTARL